MNIISSLEYGRKPFIPDKTRGHWANVEDYISAAIAVSFKLDLSSFSWMFLFRGGVFDIIPCVLSVAFYVVPLMLIYSYLGQFSSSGYISALRVSPLFKALGYIGMAVNFCVLTFLSTYASTPLFYLLHSFWPTLPWSCDGMKEWSKSGDHICNETLVSALKEMNTSKMEDDAYITVNVPSVMFYREQYNVTGYFFTYEENPEHVRIPWQLVICNFVVWGAVAYIFHIYRSTEKLGRLINLMTCTTCVLMLVCLLRFLFLPATHWKFSDMFEFDWTIFLAFLFEGPVMAVNMFGSGWGSVLSVASYNKFPTDFGHSIWLICGGQLLVLACFGLINTLIEGHLDSYINADNYFVYLEQSWTIMLSSGSVLDQLSYPNLWCILYFSMLTISSVLVLIIQAHSFFTALFDEFAQLRERKNEIIFGLLGLWAFLSLHQFSLTGMVYHVYLSIDVQATQISLHMLLFLVIMWGYGHERFLRDVEFMLGYKLPPWLGYVMRFVTPIIMLFSMFKIIEHCASFFYFDVTDLAGVISFACTTLPWIAFPIMIGYLMRQATGPLLQRWKKICLPTDWYPVEQADRRRYEETFGDEAVGGTKQLHEEFDPEEEVP